MTLSDQAEARLAAAMAGAAARTDVLSVGLTLAAAASLLFDAGWMPASLATITLGLVARYYGFRIAIDRRLFDDLADERMAASDLDAALRAAIGRNAGAESRSVAERSRGMRRLLAFHALVTVAQVATTALAAWLG
jgi:hypothetical protein